MSAMSRSLGWMSGVSVSGDSEGATWRGFYPGAIVFATGTFYGILFIGTLVERLLM